MNNFLDTWVTKKNFFILAAAISAYLVLTVKNNCDSAGCYTSLNEILTLNAWVILVALLFSVVTLPLKVEIFRAWIRLAIWWVPVSMILIGISPKRFAGGGQLFSAGREDVAFAMAGLFIIISLIIIAWKYVATRKG
jgi:hypothetical protein